MTPLAFGVLACASTMMIVGAILFVVVNDPKALDWLRRTFDL